MSQDPGRKRQTDVYIGGMSGKKPAVPIDFYKLREKASQNMTEEAYAYIACGAGLESTMDSNRRAFERYRIMPRMLRDVSDRDTSIELFGKTYPNPFLTCPIGVLEMAHADADLAVARATAAEDITMIFSNQASVPMEDCAREMGGGSRWFQLYWSKSNDLVRSLVQRAERAGCEAIVVTLDTTMLGWRTRDLDLAYLPFLRGKGIAQYTSDPVFMRLLDEAPVSSEVDNRDRKLNLDTLKNLAELIRSYPDTPINALISGKPLAAVRQFIGIYSRPSLTWEDLGFLRECTSLPILLKGITHPEDARMAKEQGIDGLIVSNHGGRQVDGAISTLDVLPEIAEVVGPDYPLLFDSGIRGGADVYKAIALGAKAVCVGRPYVYGLAAGGEQGVREVLQNFKADFSLTMGLAGCTEISQITRDTLRIVE